MRKLALPGTWLILALSPASAVTYFVNPQGTGDYPTIRAAMEASHSGDVIELADGIYTGPENHNIDYGGRMVTVRSRNGNPEFCIVECGGSGGHGELERGFVFQTSEFTDAVLEGITITHGTATAI